MNFSGGRLRLQLIVVAAFLVAISGIIVLYAISISTERNRVNETRLYQLQSNANELNSNEWEAIANGKVDSDMRAKSEFSRREVLDDLQVIRSLQGPDVLMENVQSAAFAYLGAIDQEFELISNGQLDEAREMDDSRVDPSFDSLDQAIRVAVSRFEVHAQRARRTTLFASVATLLGCLVSILLLALRFEHARTMQETNTRLNELVTQLSLSQGKSGGLQPRQERVPRQHEPRNPHAPQRRNGDDRSGPRDRTDLRAARMLGNGQGLRRFFAHGDK